VVTRIAWDGTVQRRVVDTALQADRRQWEELTARALAVPPPYRPVLGIAVYHVCVDGYVILAAEHDLAGPLLDLITAVLGLGREALAHPGFANSFAKPS
jgi:hypothetical protein